MKKAAVISTLAVLIIFTVIISIFFGAENLYSESWTDDMYSAAFEMNGRTVIYSTGDPDIKFKNIDGKLKKFDRAFRSLKLNAAETDPVVSDKTHTRARVYSDDTEFEFRIGMNDNGKETAMVSFYDIKPERYGAYEVSVRECGELIKIIGEMFTYEEYPAEYGTSVIDSINSQEWEWLEGSTKKDSRSYIIEDEYAEKILFLLKNGSYTPVDRSRLKVSEDYHYVTLYNESTSVKLKFYAAYYPDHRRTDLLEVEKDGVLYSYEVDFSIYTSVLFGDGHNLIVDEMFRDWKDFSYCEYEFLLDGEAFSIPAAEFDIQNTAARWLEHSFISCFGAEHESKGNESADPAFVLECGAETDSGMVYDRLILTCSSYGVHTRYWLKAELENSPDFLEWEKSYCYELTKADYDDLVKKAENAKEVYGNDSGIS